MLDIIKDNSICDRYTPIKLDKIRRIIAIGDIHGDYDLAIKLLELGKVIKYNKNTDHIEWIGKDTYVVQTGDQLDGCRPVNGIPCYEEHKKGNIKKSDIRVLKMFTELDIKAQKHQGRVISLLGNHEINNVLGIMKSASQDDIEYFSNYDKVKSGEITRIDERIRLFKPGQEFGKFLGCSRLLFVIIGNNFFCHAGLIKPYIDKIIKKNETPINALTRVNEIFRHWLVTGEVKDNDLIKLTAGITDDKYGGDDNNISILWDRILGKINPGLDKNKGLCVKEFLPIMQMLNLENMIIGHTPQIFMNNDSINGTCSDRLWRIDNALSEAFDSLITRSHKNKERKYQVLEIINDLEFKIISEKKMN